MKGCDCLRPGECQGLGPKNEKQGTLNSQCCPGVLLPIVTESLVPRRPSLRTRDSQQAHEARVGISPLERAQPARFPPPRVGGTVPPGCRGSVCTCPQPGEQQGLLRMKVLGLRPAIPFPHHAPAQARNPAELLPYPPSGLATSPHVALCHH